MFSVSKPFCQGFLTSLLLRENALSAVWNKSLTTGDLLYYEISVLKRMPTSDSSRPYFCGQDMLERNRLVDGIIITYEFPVVVITSISRRATVTSNGRNVWWRRILACARRNPTRDGGYVDVESAGGELVGDFVAGAVDCAVADCPAPGAVEVGGCVGEVAVGVKQAQGEVWVAACGVVDGFWG